MVKRGFLFAVVAAVGLISCGAAQEPQPTEASPADEVSAGSPEEELELQEPAPPQEEPPSQGALQARMKTAASPPKEPTAAEARARAIYDEAWVEIVQNGELAKGIGLLEQAVEIDPEFGEAWYELGTGRVTLALQRLSLGDAADAETLYRRGIEGARRARELLAAGRVRLYDAFELHDKLAELDAELEDADARLADPQAVPEKLRELAVERGWLEEASGAERPETVPAETEDGSGAD